MTSSPAVRWVGAGFTSATPWLPLAADYAERNVERQQTDPRSLHSLYRALLALRRREPALHAGTIESVEAPQPGASGRREGMARLPPLLARIHRVEGGRTGFSDRPGKEARGGSPFDHVSA